MLAISCIVAAASIQSSPLQEPPPLPALTDFSSRRPLSVHPQHVLPKPVCSVSAMTLVGLDLGRPEKLRGHAAEQLAIGPYSKFQNLEPADL